MSIYFTRHVYVCMQIGDVYKEQRGRMYRFRITESKLRKQINDDRKLKSLSGGGENNI